MSALIYIAVLTNHIVAGCRIGPMLKRRGHRQVWLSIEPNGRSPHVHTWSRFQIRRLNCG